MKRFWVLGLGVCVLVSLAACAGGGGEAIGLGSVVRLHYSLEADGEMVVPRDTPEEMRLVVGRNAYPPDLERSFLGLRAGDQKIVRLTPEQAYGTIKPGLFVRVPKNKLPDGIQEGQIVGRTDNAGRLSGMRIVKILDDTVVVDQNHPLAGRALVYHVKILEIAG